MGEAYNLEVYSTGLIVAEPSLISDVAMPWSNVFTVFAHRFDDQEMQKYFTENIKAIWASSFKVQVKSETKEQLSVCLTSPTSLFWLHIMFLQITFNFDFLLWKPCLFSLEHNLAFILHRGNLVWHFSHRWIKVFNRSVLRSQILQFACELLCWILLPLK